MRLAPQFSAEVRAAIFHFTVFTTMGVSSVYFAIWLTEKGIAADQIGIINAVPVVVMLGVNMFIGRLADRASDWRTVILILALLGGIVPIGLFFVNEFWGIIAIWTLCMMTSGTIAPLIDAATVRLTQRNGTDFGAVRAWGTVGYTVASALTGVAIVWFGTAAFVPLFLGLALLRAAAALQLPRFRAPAHEATLGGTKPGAAVLREVLKPWFILPVLAFALVQSTHSIMGAFTALAWHGEGISDGTIGLLMAVSAGAEAVMMFVWRRLGWKISARHMILAAGAATILRWTIMAFNPPVAVLFATQLLHAITYGMGYFGLVHFIANWTSEDIAAEAQGFAFVLQQAVAVVALLGFGILYASFGIGAFLGAAAFGVIAVACVLVSLRLRPAK